MKRRRQLISSDQAVPCSKQLTAPCSDCPFARTALPGWLGGNTIVEWLQFLHSDTVIPCHTTVGPQCAGAAIYRANVLKTPRSPEILRLPADRKTCFASPNEFTDHHASFGVKKRKGA